MLYNAGPTSLALAQYCAALWLGGPPWINGENNTPENHLSDWLSYQFAFFPVSIFFSLLAAAHS